MILMCKSCEKEFVVPDAAITASGRLVQCGSCGNKWKQFPIKNETKVVKINENVNSKKIQKLKDLQKPKRKKSKKTRDISLYTPEYLAKKHGISLGNEKKIIDSTSNNKVSFGFYNSLILFIVIVIALSRSLHFTQDFIIQKFPFTKFYIDYFFENIRNIFEIWKNLISNY